MRFDLVSLDSLFTHAASAPAGQTYNQSELFTPSFPSHSRRATTMFALRGISDELKPLVIKNYIKVNKKCSKKTENNFGDPASSVLFFVITTGREEKEPLVRDC